MDWVPISEASLWNLIDEAEKRMSIQQTRLWEVIGKVEKDFNALSDKEKIAKVASAAKTIARKGASAGD